MGFFSKTFANIKSSIVSSVVEAKVNKLEKQLHDSIEPMSTIFDKAFGLYSTACNKVMVATAKGVTNNKTEVIALVSENADTLKRIADLVKQLDTERNRHLLGSIGKSWIQIIKNINNEMESEFNDDFPKTIKPACDAIDKIWDLKPTSKKRKVTETTSAHPTISISQMIGEGKNVLLRKTYDYEGATSFTLQMWIDNEEVDTMGSDFDWANHEVVAEIEAGKIVDIYFYDIALDTKEQIDARFK